MQETNDCERFGKGAYNGAAVGCVYRMAASFEMMKLKAPENRSLFIFHLSSFPLSLSFYFCFFFSREIQCVIKIVKTVIDALHEKNAPNIKMRRRVLP